jgi:hypothetical protein
MSAFVAGASRLALLFAGVVAVAGVVGTRRFARLIRADVESLLAGATPPPGGVVTEELLEELPEPARRFLRYAGVIGRPLVGTVRLTQTGQIQVAAGQPWFPLRAEQHFSVQPPGFVWQAVVPAETLPLLRAKDTFLDGSGRMLITAAGLVPIVDSTGPELDQGEMLRFLSEMMWFPTAFLGANVSFESRDDDSTRVSLTHGGRTATGTIFVDADGKVTKFEADRYHPGDSGKPSLQRWSTPVDEYGEFNGLRIPVRVRAVWHLPTGDLEYIRITITELLYDPPRTPRGD